MDTYKLTYFNLRGIVEPIRFLFKYVNVPFEDNHIDATTWTDVREDYEWRQLPVLEYNGKILTQSGAIGNFLARKFDLHPEDSWDQAKCEEIIGAVHDLRLHVKPVILAKVEGKPEHAKNLQQQLLTSMVPIFLSNLEEILDELRSSIGNGDKRTDLILGREKPTWADFTLAHFTDQWASILEAPNLLDRYHLLKKQQEAVYKLEGVAKWIAERPQAFV